MIAMIYRSFAGLSLLLFSICLTAQPLFDTHLHYTEEDAAHFSPQEILNLLDKNTVHYAVITGTDTKQISSLYRLAPERIVPLLGLYRFHTDKTSWVNDKTLIPVLEKKLQRDFWRGIGELHIFARDRHSKVFAKVVALASAAQLPLLIHADPAVIDKVYDINPLQTVIWAHAGSYPYPDLISDYLGRYPKLFIDVSMRDERITADGNINDDWYELFISYPDRIMIGVDTFSTSRWKSYDSATKKIRGWLAQLPKEVAIKIGFNNAARLYKKPVIPNARN